MVRLWATDGFYSQGFLIPILAAFVCWTKREKLQRLPIKPTPLGVLLVALSVVFTVALGEWFMSLTPLLLLLVIAGLVLAFKGLPTLKELAFPFGLCLLMVPLPPGVLFVVDYPLQLFCAKVTAGVASSLGIPVERQGVQLVLPNFTMTVAPACNGLRASAALLTSAILYVYLAKLSAGAGLLILLSAIPFAYFANLFRLFIDVLFTNALGTSRFVQLEVYYDYVWGFLTFVIAIALMLGLGEALRCRQKREPTI